MIKDIIIGSITLILGICWITGGIYGITTSIINGIIINDITYSIGGVCGAGIILALGYYVFRYGYKRMKQNKKIPG